MSQLWLSDSPTGDEVEWYLFKTFHGIADVFIEGDNILVTATSDGYALATTG